VRRKVAVLLVAVLLSARRADANQSAALPADAGFEAVAAAAARAREAGEVEAAIGLYRRGTAMRPSWDEGTWYIGALEYERRRFAIALAAFTRLLERQTDHAGAEAMAGLCELELGRQEAALRRLMRARELGVAHTPGIASVVRYQTGILLTRFGEFEVGAAVLSEPGNDLDESQQLILAFGLNTLRMPILPSEIPEPSRPLVEAAGRAALAMAARRADTAQRAFDALVGRFPNERQVHYARGVFRLASQPDLAIADFERELEISPGHQQARLQLAFEWLRRGEVAKARPYAEAVAKQAPEHPVARLALGQTHLEAGETAAAIAELEMAVQLAPSSAQAHFVLARAYARAGRTAEAERERQEFARLDKASRPR
jgi:tetratricopeptide (TPR) repeat protein